VEKYSRATKATGDNIKRRMRLVCWMTKSRNALLEYVTLINFTTKTVVTRTRLNFTLDKHCLTFHGFRSLQAASDVCKYRHFSLHNPSNCYVILEALF